MTNFTKRKANKKRFFKKVGECRDLKAENAKMKAEIQRLKENLAHISGTLQAFLIFSEELSLSSDNRIVDNRTGEVLSE